MDFVERTQPTSAKQLSSPSLEKAAVIFYFFFFLYILQLQISVNIKSLIRESLEYGFLYIPFDLSFLCGKVSLL